MRRALREPEAFGQLYDRYFPQVFSYVLKRVGDVRLAQDLVSETFYKAYTRLWQFHFRSLPFGAWLYRIALNETRMHFRGKKILISLDFLSQAYGWDASDGTDLQQELIHLQDEVRKNDLLAQIREALLNLPTLYQEVLSLRFLDEKSNQEIAQILGKKEGTVKSLIHRGLHFLRNRAHLFALDE